MDSENPKEDRRTIGHRQSQDLGERPAGIDSGALDPALQQQVDENLQLLFRSKLEASLPDSLQALVQKLLDEGKPH